MSARIALACACALVLLAVALAGCGRVTGGTALQGAQSVGSSTTIDGVATQTPAGAAGLNGTGASSSDPSEIDAQLRAMQQELDSMSMPSDGDFNGAAGAVY